MSFWALAARLGGQVRPPDLPTRRRSLTEVSLFIKSSSPLSFKPRRYSSPSASWRQGIYRSLLRQGCKYVHVENHKDKV